MSDVNDDHLLYLRFRVLPNTAGAICQLLDVIYNMFTADLTLYLGHEVRSIFQIQKAICKYCIISQFVGYLMNLIKFKAQNKTHKIQL